MICVREWNASMSQKVILREIIRSRPVTATQTGRRGGKTGEGKERHMEGGDPLI